MRNAGHTFHDLVRADGDGETVLGFYARRYRHFDEARWREAIEAGQVALDGRAARADDVVRTGARLAYTRPPWDEPDVPLDFGVLLADDHVVALAKPAGLPVLPGAGCQEHTLLHLARRRLDPALSPVHRLDRGTSGVVLMARTPAAAASLMRAMTRRRVGKVYLARVAGTGLPDAFTIDRPIGEVPFPPLGRSHGVRDDGRPAVTHVRVLARGDADTLVEVRIETGRSHQIRIHLAWAGFPLVGERLFGPGGLPRPPEGDHPVTSGDVGYLLHAWRLDFPHPAGGRRVEVVAPCGWGPEKQGQPPF